MSSWLTAERCNSLPGEALASVKIGKRSNTWDGTHVDLYRFDAVADFAAVLVLGTVALAITEALRRLDDNESILEHQLLPLQVAAHKLCSVFLNLQAKDLMMKKLHRKIALVTGSSKGIGAAIARQLAKDGATVIVNYTRSREDADRVVSQILETGARAYAIRADVSNALEVKALFKEIGRAHV